MNISIFRKTIRTIRHGGAALAAGLLIASASQLSAQLLLTIDTVKETVTWSGSATLEPIALDPEGGTTWFRIGSSRGVGGMIVRDSKLTVETVNSDIPG